MKHEPFRLVAEFAPQQESLLVWPQRPDNWRNGGKPAQKIVTQIAEQIAQTQPVTVFVNQDQYLNARTRLSSKIRVVEMSSNDAFIRDYGPFFVSNGHELRTVDFTFNAWGGLIDGLYFPWHFDDQIARKIADYFRLPSHRVKTVLEGCAIHTDGCGTGIGTRDVLLAEDRNPKMTEAVMNQLLHDELGIEKMIWLDHGYFLDETGGDVDNLLNFVAPHQIVLTWTDDQADPVYQVCRAAEKILRQATDAQGQPFEIHRLQIPQILTLTTTEAATVEDINGSMPRNIGQRLTATYVNYITTTKQIIMPLFDDPADELAQAKLAQLYPDRQVIGIPAREILIGGGGLHTIVTHVPAI
ncbi:agmatine deiminase [Limosilactobacillus ingluviei]|uniref:agmatine deiminase n=1 Tax=Limosilactobacillus ingluviei TaxID=148604 RepID=UPI0024BAEF77|nr:agmatine deiminase [Limosilactobacillus ingluviei]